MTTEGELPNEFSSSYSPPWRSPEFSGSLSGESLLLDLDEADSVEVQRTWQMNYNESAIYLEEGFNNDKFDYHPRTRDALPAYLLVHNRYFYLLDLTAALVLLFLAIVEKPAISGFDVSAGFHASLELLALAVVSVELWMKLRWMGVKPFLKHKRTCIKLVALVLMIIEATVVLIRRNSHVRVSRSLRPVFVIDNYYCGGIRRVLRQIIQSLSPIIDILLLLLFFMLIFALFGFYLFSSNPEDDYFSSLEKSFVSLFVLVTTANFPDVMLPSYAQNRWSCLFFVAFLIIHLYFIMNLMLAVVYDTFSRFEKQKFKKLFFHRRTACKHAFRLLVTRSNPTKMSFRNFIGLMRYYKPKASKLDVYLMFKTLNGNKGFSLSLEDFYNIYEVAEFTWEEAGSRTPWFAHLRPYVIRRVGVALQNFASSKAFDCIVNVVVASSMVWEALAIWTLPVSAKTPRVEQIQASPVTGLFICFYVLEAVLKILGSGIPDYFSKFWNVFDFSITIASLTGVLMGGIGYPFAYVFMLRSFRLLKFFELKKRYRDIMETFSFIITKRFAPMTLVILIVYYFFGIIGMELFAKYDMRNCCRNSSVEPYFADNNSSNHGYYHLCTFQNIGRSYVTLFELMVVNNWFIIMDAYAFVTNEWSRLFFMTFYISTMIFVTVIVAFVVDAFLFRTQYAQKVGQNDDSSFTTHTALTKSEIHFCRQSSLESSTMLSVLKIEDENSETESPVMFTGNKTRTKFTFSLVMYADEVKQWLEEAKEEERRQCEIPEDSELPPPNRRTNSCVY